MESIFDEIQYQRIIKYHPTERGKCWFINHSLRPNVAIKYFNSEEHKLCCGKEAIQCLKTYIKTRLSLTWSKYNILQIFPINKLTPLLENHLEDPFFIALTCREHEIYDQLKTPILRKTRDLEDYIMTLTLRRDINIETKLRVYTWLCEQHINDHYTYFLQDLVYIISYFATPEVIQKWPDFNWNVKSMLNSNNVQVILNDDSLFINGILIKSEEIKWNMELCTGMYDVIKMILDDTSNKYKKLKNILGITQKRFQMILDDLKNTLETTKKRSWSYVLYYITFQIGMFIHDKNYKNIKVPIESFQYNEKFTYDDFVKYKHIISPYKCGNLIYHYVCKYGCDSEDALNNVIKEHNSRLNPLNEQDRAMFVHIKYQNEIKEGCRPFIFAMPCIFTLMQNMSLTLDNCIKYLTYHPLITHINKGLYYNSSFLKMSPYDSDVFDYIKKYNMAKRIQRQWRHCISNPKYLMCRKRLLTELSELTSI